MVYEPFAISQKEKIVNVLKCPSKFLQPHLPTNAWAQIDNYVFLCLVLN